MEEDGDAEEENLLYSGLAAFAEEQFRKAKDDRQTEEESLLMAYRNCRGTYGPEMQFTDIKKSKAFIKITKTKVLAALAQIVDVLYAGPKFPISIEPRNYPANVADVVNYDLEALSDEKVQNQTGSGYQVSRTIARPEIAKDLGVYKERLQPVEDSLELGAGITQSSITFEPAKKTAQMMERKIQDQLDESKASKHLRSVAFECSLIGTGIMKGPFAFDKEYPNWDSEGNY